MAKVYGRGHIAFGGQALVGQITIRARNITANVATVAGGPVRKIVVGIMHEITLVHDGRVIAEALDLMTKYAGSSIPVGQPLFTDADLVLHAQSGQTRTYHNAALRTMSPIRLSPKGDKVFGTMTFIALPKVAARVADNNSLFTDATTAYVAPATYDAADILTGLYTCAYGGDAPWDEFYAMNGINIAFDLQVTEEPSDSKGICNMILAGCSVSATLTPDAQNGGPSYADVQALLLQQGSGAAVGRSLVGANDLVITGPGNFVITLKKPGVSDGSETYGISGREGEMTFVGSREFDAGVVQPALVLTREEEEEEP